ncbi:hypothetical protein CDV36_011223 [Fusarium kuroshium]|uniref:Nucleotidyl transferase AbiEii/AbiGii toxin family protein n=2 Tax=Fusarium solani species complex TaxID=232080 RepID=A0A3M2RV44_9HYPO|nr:hypothetical protein CDV36_011223 [Fusarium kuroshium]RSL94100.1 hypothetical protein CEP52_012854 [Fusarium oligoseptatum]
MAEIYDTDRFGELYYASREPSRQNLALGARYLNDLFAFYQVPFAFLGGWAVYLRGGQRRTQDVDIAVATTMENLKAILMTQARVCFPQTHGAACAQIFIHTGGQWDQDFPNSRCLAISADVIITGNLGTPPDLPNGSEMIRLSPSIPRGSNPEMPVIDIFYQMTGKLQAYSDRQSTNDYIDLQFLVMNYINEVSAISPYLDHDQLVHWFNDYEANNTDRPDFVQFMRDMLGFN